MKNRLSDVHNHLMLRLESLSDESLKGDALDAEIKRSKTTVEVAGAITANARTVLDATKFLADQGVDVRELPMITGTPRNNT